ncbi:MAG: outer membrane protein [Gammaproteobacteria bacterium]|jgi:outer membrane protein
MFHHKIIITTIALQTRESSHQPNKRILNRVTLWLIVSGMMIFLVSNMAMAQTDKLSDQGRKRVPSEGFLYGIALIYSDEIYKGVDNSVNLLPIIGYRGDRLKVFGPLVSYTLTQAGPFELLALLKPRFDGFDDSDSIIYQGMSKRRSSIDIGLGMNYEINHWKFKVSGTRDLLDRSDGSELITKIGKIFRVGPLSIEPNIGLNYLDSNHVDYYYGVRQSEATVNRAQYFGNSALNTTLGINLATPIFLGGFSRLGIEHTWFDTSIANSPLTDADTSLKFTYSFNKFF